MSKMASLLWLLVALLLLALCHVNASVWFTEPATRWIVQSGIILIWLLIARFGFAVRLFAWLRPTDKKEEDAERIFGPLCDRHPSSFWQPRKKQLPWLLVTGQAAHVEDLMPGLITERWQVGYRGVFLWCGEPGQVDDADILFLRRRRGRRALNAVLWLTNAGDAASHTEVTQRTLWQQLKHLGVMLGWRVPVYAIIQRKDEHEQYDRPRQSAGICWTPDTPAEINAQLVKLSPELVAEGMRQVQHNRRWSWLLQLAQDIRQKELTALALLLQPLANARNGVLLSGLFMMPVALPGQHAGYREISLSPAWYAVLQQARTQKGKRDHLLLRDWLYRGVLVIIGLWCTGMLVSAFFNARLIRANHALLTQNQASVGIVEQLNNLLNLQRQTETLLWRSREGTPFHYRFGLSQNEQQLSQLWPAWQRQNQHLMLEPVMKQLTAQLRQYVDLPPDSPSRRTQADATYQYIKAYLMLTQPMRAEPAFLQRTLAPLWHLPDKHIRPGEWMMLSSEMLGFYSRELPRHPDWRQPADAPLVASVRTLLRGQNGLRNSESTLYQFVLQQTLKQHAALSLGDISGNSNISELLFTDKTLPGIFTREAWEKDVRPLIAKVSASRQIMTDWVLDDGKTSASKILSEETLRNRLTERYFTDYAAVWLAFLNSLQWQRTVTLSDTIDQLIVLGDSQRSPLIALGKMLRWQAGAGQEGKTVGESLLISAKQLVSGAETSEQQTIASVTGAGSKPADVVTQTFAPLLAILPAEEGQKHSTVPMGGLTLQDYLLQVTPVRLLLQQIITSQAPQAGMLTLMQEELSNKDSVLSAARRRASLLAASLGQDWSGFAAAAFSEPLDQAWQSVQEPAAQALNNAWQQQVVTSWQDAFSERYPFAATTSDASLPLLAHFLTPQSGVINQFISQQLHGLVEKQGDKWVAASAVQQLLEVNPAFLEAINLLSRTGRLVFAQGEASLRFDLQMRPQRNIVESTLQLDDAILKYFNQQAEWQSLTWPDKQTAHPQAVLSYIPFNNNSSAILPPVTALSFNGPWSVVRLLDKARSERLDSSHWRMTWTDKNGQTLSLFLRTESYAGPLELLKLKGFTLPATVFSAGAGAGNAH